MLRQYFLFFNLFAYNSFANSHRYDKNEKTALNRHEEILNHRFDFEGARILATEKHDFSRCLLEMVHILKTRDQVCNARADVDKLGFAYHQFFLPESADW